MEEEKDVLDVEYEGLEQEEKEIIANMPLTRIRKKKAENRRQKREKEARKIQKELDKLNKKTAKASREVEKFAKKRTDLLAEGNKWSKDKQHAWGVVQSLVAKANGLRAELKKLETAEVEQSKGMTRTEAYEQAVKNLRKPVGGVNLEIGEEGEGNKIVPNRTIQVGDKK